MIHRRRAFLLILVIVLIGAIGLTLSLVGRHFSLMTRWTRFSTLDIRTAQLLTSGQAWMTSHRQACRDMSPGDRISLDIDDLLPPGEIGSLTITPDETLQERIITATVRWRKQASTMRVKQPIE